MNRLIKKVSFSPILALLIAVVIGGLFLLISGYNPISSYGAMLSGALGSKSGILQVLLKTTPLIFSGLAAAVAFRCGVFNIGIEGQLYIGAFTGALVGIYVKGLPAIIHIPLVMAAGALGGALWAYIPAILKLKRHAHEFVTSIMLNYVAILLTNFMVNYPFKAEGMTPESEILQSSARIARIFPKNQLTWAILIAVFALIIIQICFKRSALGFELEATGTNPLSAQACGIPIQRTQLLAMLISGALAGLGGVLEVMGTYGRFIQEFATGIGYNGIAVAILGGNTSLGVLLGSVLFAVLGCGGMVMTRTTGIASEFVEVVQAIIILMVSAPALISAFRRRERKVK